MPEQPPKKIGLWTTTSIVVGNMIGSGVFMLPATLAIYGGISLLGWVFSGLGAFFLALVYSRLGRMMPVAKGGPYAYTRVGMGDFAAFLVAWGYWISVWCTNAAIAVAFVSYLSVFFPSLSQSPVLAVATGLSAIWLLTWINTKGIREAGFVQLITTILKLVPLFLIAVGGLFYIQLDNFVPFNTSNESDMAAITASATLTLFAFLGMECATIPSNSVENPEKTVPRATMLGTTITTMVYILSTVAVMGIIPPEILKDSNAPFADAAARIWGDQARYWISAGALISSFGALNGWILIQGQIPAAAGKDKLFPKIFARENKNGMPAISLVLSSLLISFLVGMNFSKSLADTYKFIILLTTMTVLVPYLFSVIAYSILSFNQSPSKSKAMGIILLSAGAFVYSLWAVAGSGEETVYWGFLLLMAGVPVYAIMKVQTQREDKMQ